MIRESIDTPLPLAEDSSCGDVSTGDIFLVSKLADTRNKSRDLARKSLSYI